jgi:hypothetical protein
MECVDGVNGAGGESDEEVDERLSDSENGDGETTAQAIEASELDREEEYNGYRKEKTKLKPGQMCEAYWGVCMSLLFNNPC